MDPEKFEWRAVIVEAGGKVFGSVILDAKGRNVYGGSATLEETGGIIAHHNAAIEELCLLAAEERK